MAEENLPGYMLVICAAGLKRGPAARARAAIPHPRLLFGLHTIKFAIAMLQTQSVGKKSTANRVYFTRLCESFGWRHLFSHALRI